MQWDEISHPFYCDININCPTRQNKIVKGPDEKCRRASKEKNAAVVGIDIDCLHFSTVWLWKAALFSWLMWTNYTFLLVYIHRLVKLLLLFKLNVCCCTSLLFKLNVCHCHYSIKLNIKVCRWKKYILNIFFSHVQWLTFIMCRW